MDMEVDCPGHDKEAGTVQGPVRTLTGPDMGNKPAFQEEIRHAAIGKGDILQEERGPAFHRIL
jgi:hypothetical protein